MSDVEVLLTVGKLDASLALLTTKNHHVIEFPTMLLPETVKAGSIVKLNISQNVEEEKKERNKFQQIQETILEKYGTHKPKAPVLKVVNVTQTSCVLEWGQLDLGSARLKSLILYRQDIRSTVIPNPFKVTTTKISGLSVDTEYNFQLRLITTSGQFWSEKIVLHTHKMTDMSGITVCMGPLDVNLNITETQIENCLTSIGAKPLQHHVAIDTTHFICNDLDNDQDEDLIRAKKYNIPIVRPEWIRACEVEKRIVSVRGFYLDADKSILKSYVFPPATESVKRALPAEVPVAEEPVAEEPVAEEPVAEEPVAEEPVAEEPVAEEPVAEEPVAEEPATEEPVTEEPIANQPAKEPVVEDPITEEPQVTEEPITEESVTKDTSIEGPVEDAADAQVEKAVVEEPVTTEPVPEDVEEPGAEDSVDTQLEKPITEEPVTKDTSSEEPATEEPATEEPATEEPATEEPATEEPATEEPATEDTDETEQDVDEAEEEDTSSTTPSNNNSSSKNSQKKKNKKKKNKKRK